MTRRWLQPLLTLLVMVGCGVAPALAAPVLGPGQSARVREAIGPPGELVAGWSVTGWRIQEEQVVISLDGPEGALPVSLRGEPLAGARSVETTQGWLHAPGVPRGVLEALRQRLSLAPLPLEWRRAEQERSEVPAWSVDGERAAAELAAVQTRWAARTGQGGEVRPPTLDPTVEDALVRLLAGEEDDARVRLEALGGPPGSWPPGGWSVWLAAGGDEPDHLVSAAEQAPWEPRIHGLLAQRARREGRLAEAAWRLDMALKLPLADQLVFDEARALGWTVSPGTGRTLPRREDAGVRPRWPWLLAGLATALGLGLVAWRRRDPLVFAAVLLGAGLWWGIPINSQTVEPPRLPVELVHPLAGGPCEATPAYHDGGGLRVDLRCDGARHALVVSPRRPGWEAHGETGAHQLSIVGDAAAPPEVVGAADRLLVIVQDVEKTGFRVPLLGDGPEVARAGPSAWVALGEGVRTELEVVGGLVGAALLLVLAGLLGLWRSLVKAWGDAGKQRPWLLGAFVVATLAHGLAPERMMMVYGGYDLAAHLIDGNIPRYGAGSVWLYGPFMWLLGSDHAWIQAVNRLAGLLCLVVAWDLGRHLWRGGEVPSAWVLAALPVLWRGHTSESIVIIPTLLVLLSMWQLVVGPCAQRGRVVVLALAAATCRPEIALMVALLPLWWRAGAQKPSPIRESERAREPGPVDLLLSAAPLWGVQVWAVLVTASAMASGGALPALHAPMAILGAMIWVGILANPVFTPLGFVPLGLWGARVAPCGRRALVTIVFVLVWIGATGVDLTEVSVPRLHTGPVLLAAPLVGLGWLQLAGWCAERRHLLVVALVVWGAGLAWSGWQCFRPVNEDEEERLWRTAVSSLPEEPGCLAVMGYGDPPPAGKTARHNPGYLLQERHPGWTTYNLTDLDEMRQRCPGPSYVLLGMRCYADLREPPRPRPEGNDALPVCRAARSTPGLETVFEWEVLNRGDLAYEMYPAGGPLVLGLYGFRGEVIPVP